MCWQQVSNSGVKYGVKQQVVHTAMVPLQLAAVVGQLLGETADCTSHCCCLNIAALLQPHAHLHLLLRVLHVDVIHGSW